MILASIPSPADAVWEIGPFPLRAYALCIILGVVVAIWLGERRWVVRGGRPGMVSDMAVWAIPFGLVGARLYHVCTNPELYFSGDGRPIEALYIWEGGLGIWGAIGLGALGAYIACRRAGASFSAMADTMAPGILFAQAIGRWGNYFNQELFGKPTERPWGLEIAPKHRPVGYENDETFQPTFLYESIWALLGGLALLWVARRYKIGYGRIFALYVMIYTAGRGWIETLRIDDAHHFAGLRLNVWTSIALFVLALVFFVWMGRRKPGREEVVQAPEEAGDDTADAEAEEAGDTDTDAGAEDVDATEAEAGVGADARDAKETGAEDSEPDGARAMDSDAEDAVAEDPVTDDESDVVDTGPDGRT